MNDLTAGETISSVQNNTFNITVSEGSDSGAAAHLSGSATIVIPDGSTALIACVQRVEGLLPGVTYCLQAVVETSLGNTKSLFAHVQGETVE